MDDEERKPVLDEIKEQVLAEGLKPDNPSFQRRFRQLQVVTCRDLHGVVTCTDCVGFDYCELIKQVMRDFRGVETPDAE